MADELSILNLRDDFEEAAGVSDAARWKLEMPGPLEVLVTLSSVTAPDEKFQARLLWIRYPDGPCSLKFCDPATSGAT